MKCVVQSCGSNQTLKQQGISFHKFPKHLDIRHKWIYALELHPSLLNKLSVVCSNHFYKSDFIGCAKTSRRLFPSAVPHLEGDNSDEISGENFTQAMSSPLTEGSSYTNTNEAIVAHEDTVDEDEQASIKAVVEPIAIIAVRRYEDMITETERVAASLIVESEALEVDKQETQQRQQQQQQEQQKQQHQEQQEQKQEQEQVQQQEQQQEQQEQPQEQQEQQQEQPEQQQQQDFSDEIPSSSNSSQILLNCELSEVSTTCEPSESPATGGTMSTPSETPVTATIMPTPLETLASPTTASETSTKIKSDDPSKPSTKQHKKRKLSKTMRTRSSSKAAKKRALETDEAVTTAAHSLKTSSLTPATQSETASSSTLLAANERPPTIELKVKCLCRLSTSPAASFTQVLELKTFFVEMFEKTRQLSLGDQREVKMAMFKAISEAEEDMEAGRWCDKCCN